MRNFVLMCFLMLSAVVMADNVDSVTVDIPDDTVVLTMPSNMYQGFNADETVAVDYDRLFRVGKRNKIAGISLMSVGGGAFVASAVFLGIGYPLLKSENLDVIGGILMMVPGWTLFSAGVVLESVGIPLYCVGVKQQKKSVLMRGNKASFQVNYTGNGLGFALNF